MSAGIAIARSATMRASASVTLLRPSLTACRDALLEQLDGLSREPMALQELGGEVDDPLAHGRRHLDAGQLLGMGRDQLERFEGPGGAELVDPDRLEPGVEPRPQGCVELDEAEVVVLRSADDARDLASRDLGLELVRDREREAVVTRGRDRPQLVEEDDDVRRPAPP